MGGIVEAGLARLGPHPYTSLTRPVRRVILVLDRGNYSIRTGVLSDASEIPNILSLALHTPPPLLTTATPLWSPLFFPESCGVSRQSWNPCLPQILHFLAPINKY